MTWIYELKDFVNHSWLVAEVCLEFSSSSCILGLSPCWHMLSMKHRWAYPDSALICLS